MLIGLRRNAACTCCARSGEPDVRWLRSFHALSSRVTWPFIRQHPSRVITVVMSVSLGVAAIVASGNLIRSALGATEDVWNAALGDADLRVSNGFGNLSEALLGDVQSVAGVEAAAGVLIEPVQIRLDNTTVDLQLIGLDLFGDELHREAAHVDQITLIDESALVSRLDAIVVTEPFAERHAIALGSTFEFNVRSGRKKLFVAGVMEPNAVSAVFGDAFIVMDLPVAQILLGRHRQLDIVDIRIRRGRDLDEALSAVGEVVGHRGLVTRSDRASEAFGSLLANLRMTLGVPGIMAMVVGGLVIRHAVLVAVSRRKPQIDVLRSLGAPRTDLILLFAFEGLVVATVGSVVGIAAGILVTPLAVGVVQQALSSLYHSVRIAQIEIAWDFAAVAVAIATLICVSSFLQPAYAQLSRLVGLNVVSPRQERWQTALRGSVWGLLLVAAGYAFGSLQERPELTGESLGAVAFLGDAMILLGSGMCVPVLLLRAPRGFHGSLPAKAVSGRLALISLLSDPGRTAVIVTTLLVGSAYVMITIGSIGSLRHNIAKWLDQGQTADFVVSGPGSIGFFPNARPLPTRLESEIARLPGVGSVEPTSLVTIPYRDRWVVLVARRPETLGRAYPLPLVQGALEAGRSAVEAGTGTIVSQHFARQHGHSVGDRIELRGPHGLTDLRIEAIVTDFSSADLGTVFVSPELLESRWDHRAPSGLGIWAASDRDPSTIRADLQRTAGRFCGCTVMSGAELRDKIIGVVDGMFYMAYALQVVAAIAVAVSVLSFFELVLEERRDQLATIRMLGATQSLVRRSIIIEAALLGLIGGTAGCAIGVPLAWKTAVVTMRAGGGFDLQFAMPLQAVFLTIASAAVLCVLGVLPELRRATSQSGSNLGAAS